MVNGWVSGRESRHGEKPLSSARSPPSHGRSKVRFGNRDREVHGRRTSLCSERDEFSAGVTVRWNDSLEGNA